MRKGSAAIVPLFLAIMLLFWAAIFLGTPSETLGEVNQLTHIKNVEKRNITAAMIMKIKLLEANTQRETPLSELEMDAIVSQRISSLMANSTIDEN